MVKSTLYAGRIAPLEKILPDIKPESKIAMAAKVAYDWTLCKINPKLILDKGGKSVTYRKEILRSLEKEFRRKGDVERLCSAPLIDLGARSCAGVAFASNLGIQKYVAVDLCSEGEMAEKVQEYLNENPEKSEGMLVGIVSRDMLSFLKRVPNNSVNAMMFGVGGRENGIISNMDYRRKVGKQITRVLSSKGVYIADDVSILPYNPDKGKLIGLRVDRWGAGLFSMYSKQELPEVI